MKHSKLENIRERLSEALNNQEAIFSWNGESLTFRIDKTGKIVMTAQFRVLGWVEEVEKPQNFNIRGTSDDLARKKGVSIHIPFWLHMAESNNVKDQDRRSDQIKILPAIPASMLRSYLQDLNPALDEVLAAGRAPSIPLLSNMRHLEDGLLNLGFDGFLDLYRELGGTWFAALKNVRWHAGI